MSVWHAVLHYSGVNNPAGVWYGFWSGIGSDIGELALLGGVIAMYRRNTCHVAGCWRLQWKHHDGHMLCKRHHPHDAPTAEEIA